MLIIVVKRAFFMEKAETLSWGGTAPPGILFHSHRGDSMDDS
jgi:hypothetical protein